MNILKYNLLFLLFWVSFNSCKKETNSPDQGEIKLISMTVMNLTSQVDSSRIVLTYDDNSRYSGYVYYAGKILQPVYTSYNIIYNGNIIITNYSYERTFPISPINAHTDTTILDADGNVKQKIKWSTRSLNYDTINFKGNNIHKTDFEYLPTGLFKQKKTISYDSVSEIKGNENHHHISYDTTTYTSTISGDILLKMIIETKSRNVLKILNTSTTTLSSVVKTIEYFHTTNSPYPPTNRYNYILEEFAPFEQFLNTRKNYQYLPDKIIETKVCRDSLGNITSTYVDEVSYIYTYTSLGYLKTIRQTSPSRNNLITYRYNRE